MSDKNQKIVAVLMLLSLQLFARSAEATSKIGPVTTDTRDPYILYYPWVEEGPKLPRFSWQYDDSQHFDRREATVGDGTRVSKHPSDFHGSMAVGFHRNNVNIGLQLAATLFGHGYFGAAFQYDLFRWENSKFALGAEFGVSTGDNPVGGFQALYAFQVPIFGKFLLTPYLSLQFRRWNMSWIEERGQQLNYTRSVMRVVSWGIHPIAGVEFALARTEFELDRIFLRLAGGYEKNFSSQITEQSPGFSDYTQKYGPFISLTLGLRWGAVDRPAQEPPSQSAEVAKPREEEPTQPAVKTQPIAPATEADEKERSLRKWYLNFALGAAFQAYDSKVAPFVKTRAGPGFDLVGVYIPLGNEKTVLGGVVNGTIHQSKNGGENDTVETGHLAFSAMHFFGRFPGDGWFLRGDLGPAWLQLSVPRYEELGNVTYWGGGATLGGGYALTLLDRIHLMVGPNYGYRGFWRSGHSVHFLSLHFGVMF